MISDSGFPFPSSEGDLAVIQFPNPEELWQLIRGLLGIFSSYAGHMKNSG